MVFLSTGECILLKIYQGWLFRPEDVSVHDYQQVHLQVPNNTTIMISFCKTILGIFNPALCCSWGPYRSGSNFFVVLFFIPQIVSFVNNLLSNNDASVLFFHPESECHCNIEVRIYMYLMVNLKFQPALWMSIISLS